MHDSVESGDRWLYASTVGLNQISTKWQIPVTHRFAQAQSMSIPTSHQYGNDIVRLDLDLIGSEC